MIKNDKKGARKITNRRFFFNPVFDKIYRKLSLFDPHKSIYKLALKVYNPGSGKIYRDPLVQISFIE
jgi:hypothetical protein